MKITTFNPMILTTHFDEVVGLFEGLGFEKKHAPIINVSAGDITDYRMEDANGFNVDVAGVHEAPRDMVVTRMNVDDFDEAYAKLKELGFVDFGHQDRSAETASAKASLMVAPFGFFVLLCQHIKD